MTWLYILLGIILLIFLILLIPIGVKVSYKGEVKAVLKIGFIPITVYPPKPKKKKKDKKKDKEKEAEEDKKKKKKPGIVKEKGILWLVDTIREAASLAKGALKSFFKHLVIKRLSISICYHGEDADDTAVKYGYFCLAVYPPSATASRRSSFLFVLKTAKSRKIQIIKKSILSMEERLIWHIPSIT